MKKEPDYAKLKALHDSILQYIGDAKDTGENPDIPKQEEDIGASGGKNMRRHGSGCTYPDSGGL